MASENKIMTDQILHLLRFFIFLVLLLQMKPQEAAHAASDRIVLGGSLTGRETRSSKNGSFELGFFNLTNNDVTNWYVGIWYATDSDSQQTIAWVANREQPLQDDSGVFNLTEAGSLILSHGGSVVWSSMGNKKKPSSAVIMESGNLVVLGVENSSEIIWQSFDHPGNTWLPGMQISISQRLTSWKNDWDPRPGPFCFQMDPSGVNQLVLLWKNDYKYWESGILHDNMFSKLDGPESVKVDDYGYSNNSNSDFTLFSNGSYKYFTYPTPNDPGRIVMDKSGKIRVYSLLDANNGWHMVDSQPDSVQVPDDAHSYKKVTVSGVVGGLAAILAFVLLYLWCRKRSGLSATEYAPGTLTVFTYRDLQRSTKNFSERLGGGGFGSVFKGTLPDGSHVAVKMLEGVSQGEKQFRTEVSTIGTIQHINLVRLRGFCTEGSARLLVYEYMINGSLNSFLFHRTQSDEQQLKVLDWKTRFGIAVGTAQGIIYLHEKCRNCIIHCDIKPENILLDSNFCPKLADFGLAKLLGKEYSHVLTTMRGTRGYLAPEWLSGLPITAKADVYSFGMTLLEIIAGRRNMDWDSESSELFFPTWAATQINSGNAMDLLDKKLLNNADAEQVKRAAIVAGWCIQDNEDDRPLMSEVLQILEGIVDVPPPPPIPLSLQTLALKPDSLVLFFWEKDSSTQNDNSDHPSTTLYISQ